jgi:hypothetical protein
VTGIRRLATQALRNAVFLIGACAIPGAGICAPMAEGCANLDAIPIQFTIDYQSAIQGIFDNHCIECHEGKQPPAGLDLSAGGSWSHLIGVPSSQDGTFTRVIPDRPELSLLFLKVNCDTPGVGHRMPLGRDPLLEEEQALILDWISEGAPSSTTDTIFRGEFEVRG